jgi:hypothetical protein
MQQETLSLQMVMEHINEGTFQEYDYNEETKECEWKQMHEESNKKLREKKND